jgi:hypothetical protein
MKPKRKKVDEDEASDQSEPYEALHMMAEDVEGGAFKVDPSPNFYGGQLKALVGKIPPNRSIFDIYFDVEANDWLHWDTLRNVTLTDPNSVDKKIGNNMDKKALFE